MIVGAQIRAARALIRWSAEDLAHHAHLALTVVRKAEAADSAPHIGENDALALRRALERGGVLFLDPHAEGPGVRLRKPLPAEEEAFVSDGNEG